LIQRYIPPPVPDDQNIAALPIFDPALDLKTKDSLTPIALGRALHDDDRLRMRRFELRLEEGRQPDFNKLHPEHRRVLRQNFCTPPITNDALAQWDAIYPFIAELNAASETRPYFRLQEDYSSQPDYGRPLVLLTSQIKVAKVLSVHAVLALNENQPELAVADIKTMLKISRAVGREPSFVAGLISVGLCSITDIVIKSWAHCPRME